MGGRAGSRAYYAQAPRRNKGDKTTELHAVHISLDNLRLSANLNLDAPPFRGVQTHNNRCQIEIAQVTREDHVLLLHSREQHVEVMIPHPLSVHYQSSGSVVSVVLLDTRRPGLDSRWATFALPTQQGLLAAHNV